MKIRKQFYFIIIAILMGSLFFAFPVYSEKPTISDEDAVVSREENPLGQRIGSPQVLEIPAQVEEAPLMDSSDDSAASLPVPSAREGAIQRDTPTPSGLPQEPGPPLVSHTGGRQNYLGVLYATAEEGPPGVKVLDIVPGSPADRAGFHGATRPPEGHSTWIKAAIVVLAMSPAGPFAIPLAIAHDVYMGRQTPGDVIVAVGDRSVRTAQEFSEAMRRYQPSETVSFSVLRNGKTVQISVQLEEEPG
jgi:PDZ domain